MQTFHTPPGRAGSDQLYGLEEAVQGDIRAMFQAGVERDVLDYGVGMSVAKSSYQDASIRMEARRRECDARITWSAGRAVERALKLVHACGTDRIMGREYPGVDQKQMKKDTQSGHGLTRLWQTILEDMRDRNVGDALEDTYQKALNPGLLVVTLDDKHMWTIFSSAEDIPLREHTTGGMSDGEEYTTDHSPDLLGFGRRGKSEFSKLPVDTFEQFLAKADQAYYERDGLNQNRRTIHWEAYSARDHERSRPYVVAGMRFFARLAQELVALSKQPWISDRARLIREIERGSYNISKLMTVHADQRYKDKGVFSSMDTALRAMTPAQEIAKGWLKNAPDMRAVVKHGYDHLRQKQPWVTKKPDDSET